jgi:hypothetical protein
MCELDVRKCSKDLPANRKLGTFLHLETIPSRGLARYLPDHLSRLASEAISDRSSYPAEASG